MIVEIHRQYSWTCERMIPRIIIPMVVTESEMMNGLNVNVSVNTDESNHMMMMMVVVVVNNRHCRMLPIVVGEDEMV